ncbi:MAG: protein kinase [Myxococcota bacterium]|nr:protein kinase [Myxococcota bacterium]
MTQGIKYGDYYLLGRLSEGGMAEVFLGKPLEAQDPNKLIAVKRIIKQHQNNPQFIAMLKDEARIAIGLEHPNICKVFELSEVNKQIFLVMEFIHGKELGSIQYQCVQNKTALPLELSIFIIAQIANALSYAHKKTDSAGKSEEIVHRDVNPQNIFISFDGQAKLIDFGIAKAKDRLTRTKLGMVKGKCGYMSPEQVAGDEVDGRSDIFALGVVLYELVTGKQAFTGDSEFEIFQNISQARYIPPQKANKHIPESLAKIMDKSLAQKLDARYQDAEEFAEELFSILHAQGLSIDELQNNLSEYLKEIYAEGYAKEINQIKNYQDILPPGAELVAPPEQEERITGSTVPEMLVYSPDESGPPLEESMPTDIAPAQEDSDDEAGGSTAVDMPIYEPPAEDDVEQTNSFEEEPTVLVASGQHLHAHDQAKSSEPQADTSLEQDKHSTNEVFEDERTRQLEEHEIAEFTNRSPEIAQLPTREHPAAESDSAVPTGVVQTQSIEDLGIGINEEPTREVPMPGLETPEPPEAKEEDESSNPFAIPKTPIQTMKITLPTEEEAMQAIKAQDGKMEIESTEEIAFSTEDISFLPPNDIHTEPGKEQPSSKIDNKQATALALAFLFGVLTIAGVYFWSSIN